MDIWLVAAAAGVGYVAQQWKNLRKGSQNLSDSSCRTPSGVGTESSWTKRIDDDKSLLPDDAFHREKLGGECCSAREPVFIDMSVAEMASTSKPRDDSVGRGDGFGNLCVLPNGNLLNGLNNDDFQRDGEGDGIDGVNRGVLSLPPPTREMGVSGGFSRKKRSLMYWRTNGRSLKPLSSLERCVMAQFYEEKAEVDEYKISSCFSPHTPSISSQCLVMGGNSLISRTMTYPFRLHSRARGSNVPMDTCSDEKTSTSGVPQLPGIALKEFRKSKSKTRTVQGRKLGCSSRRATGKGHHCQGSSDEALIFLLGVSFGIMSSLWANNQEVDKLNRLLKQSENLVQDLQEELEMKDSLTVKELAVEHHESQGTQNDGVNQEDHNSFSLEEKQDNYQKERCKGKVEEECFSKIEAELEAELERLELNMSACRLGGKPSDEVEGELKVKISTMGGDPLPYADLDGSGSSSIHPANYAVSPRELSLRLHEVIESRLEQRVRELETELERRQRKDQFTESEHMTYWEEHSNSNSGSSYIQTSPVLDVVEQQNHQDQYMVVNLPGDTSDAYSEDHGELTKMEELDDKNTPFSSRGIYKQETLKTCDQHAGIYDARLHNSLARNSFTDEKPILFPPSEKRGEDGFLSHDFITSGDESDDGSEEMEKLLIQHIVDQARKGSPVVLNAQKMLFSPVDDRP